MKHKCSGWAERGAATLAVALLLLFGTSIVVFYLNRGLIFEQKTSANQARSTAAFEAAEAGLEWATGMLNDPRDVVTAAGNTCQNATGVTDSFRTNYVPTTWAGSTVSLAPVTTVSPGCFVNNGASPTCNCPTAGTATLTPAGRPGFTVSFATVPLPAPAVGVDPESIRVTSVGCSNTTAACTAGATTDATVTVSAVLKLRRILRSAPAAALTCGTTCSMSGSFNVANFDASTNGITVNSGSATSGASGAVATVPGMPAENSIVMNDSTLAALTCNNDSMFSAYFGSTIAEFAASPATATIASGTEADFTTGFNNGFRSFYFPNGAAFQGNGPNIGTATDPVTFVIGSGSFDFNSHRAFYGLAFSNTVNTGVTGTGSSQIYGAVVACGAANTNGNGVIVYDGTILSRAQLGTATLVRVPGSWRDF